MPLSERIEASFTGKIFYPRVKTPDQWGKLSVDMVLEGPQLEKAKEYGLNVKQPTTGAHSGPYVTFRVSQDEDVKEIPTVDDKGAPITVLVGNESFATVNFAAGPYVFKGKFGVYACPLKMVVHNLIPYKKKETA